MRTPRKLKKAIRRELDRTWDERHPGLEKHTKLYRIIHKLMKGHVPRRKKFKKEVDG